MAAEAKDLAASTGCREYVIITSEKVCRPSFSPSLESSRHQASLRLLDSIVDSACTLQDAFRSSSQILAAFSSSGCEVRDPLPPLNLSPACVRMWSTAMWQVMIFPPLRDVFPSIGQTSVAMCTRD